MINLKIIHLAANTTNYGLKKNSNHFASWKNKICGDKIKIEINSNGLKSCIFCQASASILSRIIKSMPVKNLKKEVLNIYDSFDNENFTLPKKYNSFRPLINKKNKNRLECIMLPFNALLKALKIWKKYLFY